MKYFYCAILAGFLAGSSCWATEYKFTFVLGRDKLEYKVEAPSKTQAYKIAAQFCFDFFERKVVNLTEDKGLEIIDACANPNEF